jgi:bifunctional protein TilS/HprT
VQPSVRLEPRRAEIAPAGSPGSRVGSHLPHQRVAFAHDSERQFAKLLDFYEIAWEYEPTTFDIQWDRDGTPTQRFSPDFYLPDFDLYIEITTLSQKLVTKKNRKVRRLCALYPDVKCKILYQRDYLSLLVKYGLEPPQRLVDTGAEDALLQGDADSPLAG